MSDTRSPRNLDAERAVLGCLLLEPQRQDDIATVIRADDFFLPAHRVIYAQLVALLEQRAAVDELTLVEALRTAGTIDQAGGPAQVAKLTDGIPRGVNLIAYASIVRELAERRRIIAVCERVIALAADTGTPADELVEQAESQVLALGQQTISGDWLMADDWMRQTWAYVAKLADERRAVTGVASGFRGLDFYTRGFQPGELIILGARPSMGKTSLAMQMALTAAHEGMTAVFSVEMSQRSLGLRALALAAQVDGMRLMTGRFHQGDYERLTEAHERLARLRLALDDSSAVTSTMVRAKARRLAAKHGLTVLFIDYLQILEGLKGAARAETRTLELAQMSRSLKQLAKELSIPVIVLSQLSRETEKRDVKRPRLSDLRESGAIEQDADVVLLLHRPEYYQNPPNPEDIGRAELIIAKQRNGSTGIVPLRFVKEHTRFEDWTV